VNAAGETIGGVNQAIKQSMRSLRQSHRRRESRDQTKRAIAAGKIIGGTNHAMRQSV
jgi:hypothetical protein